MGTRTEYEPGTFCWVDLITSDAEGAKAFYGELFGWEFTDNDMGGGAVYSMGEVGGNRTAGVMGGADQPPHWNSYIAVASAEETVRKAEEAGAKVVQPVVEIPGSGKMAFVQDPSGATVGLWEAEDNIGAQLVNAHGAFSWNDLQTHDVDKAVEFYTGVFGWEVGTVEDDEEHERVMIRVGETQNGGMAKLPDVMSPETPPHWLVFFAVDDVDAAIETAERAGGAKQVGPLDLPAGRIAILTDPQGAAFALFAGELDD